MMLSRLIIQSLVIKGDRICLAELELKDTTYTAKSPSYIDLHIDSGC
jgi:hypothetical protein